MATDRPLCDRSLPCYPLLKTAAVWMGNVSRQHKGLGVSTFGPQSLVLTWKAMNPCWGGPHWEDVVCWGQALRPYSPTLLLFSLFLDFRYNVISCLYSSHRECPAFPQKVTLIIALLVNLTQPRTKRSSGRGVYIGLAYGQRSVNLTPSFGLKNQACMRCPATQKAKLTWIK